MIEYLMFWLAKVLVEHALFLLFILALVLFALALTLKTAIKQRLCKHESTRETMACDVVCRKCDKNFGFIGRVDPQYNPYNRNRNRWRRH